MDLTAFTEPTTIIGLAGLSIWAIIYIANRFIKSMEKKDNAFNDFVQERNHQVGDIIVKNTEVLIEVKDSIRNHTQAVAKLIELHTK